MKNVISIMKMQFAALSVSVIAVLVSVPPHAIGAGLSWTNVRGEITPSKSATGTATLVGLGPSIPVNYTVDSSGKFNGSGAWTGSTTAWKAVPNVQGAEFRIVSPSIQLTVKSSPATFSAILSAGKIEVQTTGKKPDGTPVAKAELVSPRGVAITGNGIMNLPLPQLPQPQAIVTDAWCNASCSEASGLGLAAAVPSGTGLGHLGQLKHVNVWRSQCEIWQFGAGTGKCKNWSTCPPGQTYFQGSDQKWSCRTSVPQLPTLPVTVSLSAETTLR